MGGASMVGKAAGGGSGSNGQQFDKDYGMTVRCVMN